MQPPTWAPPPGGDLGGLVAELAFRHGPAVDSPLDGDYWAYQDHPEILLWACAVADALADDDELVPVFDYLTQDGEKATMMAWRHGQGPEAICDALQAMDPARTEHAQAEQATPEAVPLTRREQLDRADRREVANAAIRWPVPRRLRES